MEPEAGPLPLGADLRVREPYRRHEIAPGELGEDPRVDLVGLAGEWCETLHLLRVGDLDVPSHELEAVVDKAGTVHRLDRRAHRSAEGRHFLGEVTEPVEIGRGLGDGELCASFVEHADVESLSAEVKSKMQHGVGASLVLVPTRTQCSRRGGPSSWHSNRRQ